MTRKNPKARAWLASSCFALPAVLTSLYFVLHPSITDSGQTALWLIQNGPSIRIALEIVIVILVGYAAIESYQWLKGIYYLHNHRPGDGRVRELGHRNWGMGHDRK